jgi:NAD dependent epimerase/dehydratase family enzyme
VYNAVAPHPVSQKVISKTIATQRGGVKVPIPIPEFALKLMLGEMSNEVLKSATVSSSKIEKQGFSFKYPKIEDAVRAILQ